MFNPFEAPQESESEKREKALAMLEDPEKRQQFERIIENLKSATPEELAKIQETGRLNVSDKAASADGEGIEFDMHIGISPEVIATIMETIKEGQEDVMEIAKKLSPEMLMMLLA